MRDGSCRIASSIRFLAKWLNQFFNLEKTFASISDDKLSKAAIAWLWFSSVSIACSLPTHSRKGVALTFERFCIVLSQSPDAKGMASMPALLPSQRRYVLSGTHSNLDVSDALSPSKRRLCFSVLPATCCFFRTAFINNKIKRCFRRDSHSAKNEN